MNCPGLLRLALRFSAYNRWRSIRALPRILQMQCADRGTMEILESAASPSSLPVAAAVSFQSHKLFSVSLFALDESLRTSVRRTTTTDLTPCTDFDLLARPCPRHFRGYWTAPG